MSEEVDFSPTVLVRWIAAVLLVLAVLPLPYGYFTFLRWFVTFAAGWTLVLAWPFKTGWKIVLVVIAILFNPIAPVYLSREAWFLIDLLTAAVLAASTWPISNRLLRVEPTPD